MIGSDVKSTIAWIKDYVNGKISKLEYPKEYLVAVKNIRDPSSDLTEQYEFHIEIITKTPGGSEHSAALHVIGLGLIWIRANRRRHCFSPEKKTNIRRYINRFFSEVEGIWNP
jgi:hypothetical protein